VARQYSGTAGRIENSQAGVFLVYGSAKGRALIDRELYLPKEWTSDRERCRSAGIGDDVEFTTKPDLGLRMLKRAVESGIPFGWVTADALYGQTSRIRVWLVLQRHFGMSCASVVANAGSGLAASSP
jgi:SRSO17 transposase